MRCCAIVSAGAAITWRHVFAGGGEIVASAQQFASAARRGDQFSAAISSSAASMALVALALSGTSLAKAENKRVRPLLVII